MTLHDDKTAALDAADLRSAVADVAVLLHAADRPTSVTFSVATTRRVVRYTITREGDETIAWPHGEIDTERWHRRSDDGKTDALRLARAVAAATSRSRSRVSNTDRGTLEVVLDSIRVDETAAKRRAATIAAAARADGAPNAAPPPACPASTPPGPTPASGCATAGT